MSKCDARESGQRRKRFNVRLALRVLAGTVLAVLGLMALLAFWPMSLPPLKHTPRPARSFSEAISRARATIEWTSPTIQPECRGEVMHHRRRTERAFVLLHGLSN